MLNCLRFSVTKQIMTEINFIIARLDVFLAFSAALGDKYRCKICWELFILLLLLF